MRVDRTSIPVDQPPSAREGVGRAVWVQLIIMAGLALILYPTTANWFSTLNHNDEITEYRQAVGQIATEERSAALQLADEYNSKMPQGPLRDPYSYDPVGSDDDEAYQAYEDLLHVSDSGVIGRISYSKVDIDLPAYHGTDDEVIAKGAGHLYGSSLPVGGPSTHAVLTAHSGLAHAELFTPLHTSKVGDEFWIEVLGEKHFYRVDEITVVEANDTEALQIVDGRDFVTLLTCTPVGVNSHRLLVRGERIAGPGDTSGSVVGDDVSAGFPWWAAIFLGGSALSAVMLFRKPKTESNRLQEPAQ